MYTFNTTTTVTVTNGAKGTGAKLLGRSLGVSIKQKHFMLAGFLKRPYKQYHRQHLCIIARNIIENFKGANLIQN